MSYIMQSGWKKMQTRVYINWSNHQLPQDMQVNNLDDFATVTPLVALWEALTGKKISGISNKGVSRILKLNNMGRVIEQMAAVGVPLVGISRENIVDGDPATILGLIWSLIQRFHLDISLFSEDIEGKTYNQKLLSWVNLKLDSKGLTAKDLKGSWGDGRLFCALISTFVPSFDFDAIEESSTSENLERAFSTAQNELGIPRLLSERDFKDPSMIDGNSVITYLSFFVHYEFRGNTKNTPLMVEVQDQDSGGGDEVLHCIPKHLFHRVSLSYDDDAYHVKHDEHWKHKTWYQFGASVRRVARSLIHLGVQPSQTVCIFGKTRPEWTIFYLAAISVGAVPTSVNSACPWEELEHIVNHSESVVLLLEKHSQWKKIKPHIHEWESVKFVIMRDASREEGLSVSIMTWRQFMRKGDSDPELETLLGERINSIQLDDPATLIYSPGTEAHRKGVLLSHRNLLFTAQSLVKLFDLTKDDCYVSFLSLSQVAEQILAIYIPIICGMKVHYTSDVTCLLSNLREIQPTFIACPPEYWMASFVALKQKLLESKKDYTDNPRLIDQMRKRIGCGRARVALTGGNSQTCPSELFDFFSSLGMSILPVYGQLETCGVCTVSPPDSELSKLSITQGRPLEGCEVKINDDGEILYKGPNVFLNYYKDKEFTNLAKEAGWKKTGDLGKLDSDGYLIFEGRMSDIITLSDGTTIAPLHLETQLRSLPLVRYAVIVGDGKDWLGALLILDLAVVKSLARKKGCTPKRLFSSPDNVHQKEIKEHIESVNSNAKVRVRRFSVVARNLSVKRGEMSCTMSIRRRVIHEKCEKEINTLYEDKGAAGGEDLMLKEGPGPTKITDGTFYKKSCENERDFERTELTQDQVENMEKDLINAMKEIRELAKQIKTLQERHEEDLSVLESKKQAISRLQTEISFFEKEGGGKGGNGKKTNKKPNGKGGPEANDKKASVFKKKKKKKKG
eukprot:CAMPEP_0174253014 /NCGR_PEP_ID=MMETSP0439-20130205/2398_1 /TAXON_ID=0 /ORGANISM="Stereomyxa ramosa, Strain Chinc5" /LENGTH=961 /DNA_ID=CAMNT_0015333797 /DNA_START=54 /DNA_END=2939 /DNA_ORIENTATION=-